MVWYYIDESITEGDRRLGPFSLNEIQELAKKGIVKNETLVWHSGDESWISWEDAQNQLNNNVDEILKNTIELLKQQIPQKQYAGFFVRLVAYIIDNLFISLFCILTLFIMSKSSLIDLVQLQELLDILIENPSSTEAMNNILSAQGIKEFLIICSIFQAVFFIFFNWKYSATPGKLALHIRIETSNGEHLSFSGAILRYIGSIFTQFTFVLYGLGYIIVCIDPKRRALHDWIAQTRVVYKE